MNLRGIISSIAITTVIQIVEIVVVAVTVAMARLLLVAITLEA